MLAQVEQLRNEIGPGATAKADFA